MEANKGANWYSQTYANSVALTSSLRFYVLVNVMTLKNLIRKGIPPVLSSKVWFSLSGAAKKKSTVPDSYYDDLTSVVQDRVTPATKQIDHDLPRTSKLMVQKDVKTQQMIILDPDDQPMWESAKTVAPTPNSVIVRPNVDDNFIINSTHLKMIRENKFDGYLRADPHDHIREFLAICDMFKYGETQSEAVKLLIFPLSLCDKAKTWFNELNEDSITSWEQMRRAFISRFFPPLLFNLLLLEIRSFS
ncbi:reverse transcriptase domain-containing protein [Tanacetum coccineum]